MPSGRIGAELAVLAMLCVLTIFLFPLVQGPYSVVNGPVTALQAARAAARIRNAIRSAVRSLQSSRCRLLAVLARAAEPIIEFESINLAACGSILRC
ncbi:MAG TPA: hypothetical protein VMI10_25355 [Terriglobales bacterium]|nr:hypothetical protein [Terriglobales bacterium]